MEKSPQGGMFSQKFKFFQFSRVVMYPVDLKTRKSTGTSCQIEMFVCKFPVDLQFSLLKTITKFQ